MHHMRAQRRIANVLHKLKPTGQELISEDDIINNKIEFKHQKEFGHHITLSGGVGSSQTSAL